MGGASLEDEAEDESSDVKGESRNKGESGDSDSLEDEPGVSIRGLKDSSSWFRSGELGDFGIYSNEAAEDIKTLRLLCLVN